MRMLKTLSLVLLSVLITVLLSSCRPEDQAFVATTIEPPTNQFQGLTYYNLGDCHYASDIAKFLSDYRAMIAENAKSADILIENPKRWYEGAEIGWDMIRVTVKCKGSIVLARDIKASKQTIDDNDRETLLSQIKPNPK